MNTNEKVRERIKKFFNGDSQIESKFSQKLKECNALLAGGFVLSAINNEKRDYADMDIYVKNKDAEKILNFFISVNPPSPSKPGNDAGETSSFSVMSQNFAPAYDQSFFRKNKIISRILMVSWYKYNRHTRRDKSIDIMIIPDNVSPVSVVKNFDLSFCEVWYNGEDVKAVDMDGLQKKEGKLKPSYVESLVSYFNPFIIKRIQRYTKRGYKIEYDTKVSSIDVKGKAGKTIISKEDWLVSKLYLGLSNSIISPETDLPNIYKNHLGEFLQAKWSINNSLTNTTLENLESVLNKFDYLPIASLMETIDKDRDLWNDEDDPYNTLPRIPDLEKNKNSLLYILLFFMSENLYESDSNDQRAYYTKTGKVPPSLYNIDPYISYIDELVGVKYNIWVKYLRSVNNFKYLFNSPENKVIKGPNIDFSIITNNVLKKSLKLFYAQDPASLDTINFTEEDLDETCKDIFGIMNSDEDENENEDEVEDKEGNKIKIGPIMDEITKITTQMRGAQRKEWIELNTEKNSLNKSIPPNSDGKTTYGEYIALFNQKRYERENKNITIFNKNIKNFIMVIPGEIEDEILCYDVNSLLQIASKSNEFLVECDGTLNNDGDRNMNSFIKDWIYVGIPINKDGFRAFFDIRQIRSLLLLLGKGIKVFYITPHLDIDGTHETISYTSSYQNAYTRDPDYVSANHCQKGSNISIYDIKVCSGGNCKLGSSDGIISRLNEDNKMELSDRKINLRKSRTVKDLIRKLSFILSQNILKLSDIDEIAAEMRKNNDFTEKDLNDLLKVIIINENDYIVGVLPANMNSLTFEIVVEDLVNEQEGDLSIEQMKEKLLDGDWRTTGYIITGNSALAV